MKLSNTGTSQGNGFSSTLRALGLQILSQINLPWASKKPPQHTEVAKPIVRTSLSASLALATIHILPVMVSTTVIGLNLGHLWLGITLPGSLTDNNLMSAMFQVLAKVQELLMVASLTTVVYHIIVNRLIAAEGVPFGFLFGTFSFSEFSYFWSSEFWGAMDGRVSLASKTSMAAILLAAGLIAAFAGPAVAVLLIPRQQDWHAGGTDFYLRANESDIFPRNLSVADLPVQCRGPDAASFAICPSGGFHALSLYTSSLQTIRNDENMVAVPTSATGQWGSYGLFQQQLVSVPGMHLGTQQLPLSTLSGSVRGIVCQTEAVAPFVPIALYSSSLSNDWESIAATAQFSVRRPSLAEYRWRNSKTVSAQGKIPAVRARCSAAQNLSTTATVVDFPVLPDAACPDGELPVSLPQMAQAPSPSARVTWVHDLPAELGSVSVGVLFEAPWTNSNTSRAVVGCSIDARWTDGDVKNNQAYPTVIASTENWKIVAGYIAPMFMPPNNRSWAPIRLDDAWVQVADAGSSLQSLLASSAIIDANITTAVDQTATWNDAVLGSANRTLLLEWITSLAVVDSLSRYGAYRFLNTTGPLADWALLDYHRQSGYSDKLLMGKPALVKPEVPDVTTYRLSIVLNGLLYRASSATDYLSMAILVGHMLIALAHTICLVIYPRSSASWDTIAEFVALAHNSKPSKRALKNASAGIRTKRPFSHVARVRAIAPQHSEEAKTSIDASRKGSPLVAAQHAQLVFVESDDEEGDLEDGSVESLHRPARVSTGDRSDSSGSEDSGAAVPSAPDPGVTATLTWPLPWKQTWIKHEQVVNTSHSRNVSSVSTKPLLPRSSAESVSRRSPYTLIKPDQLYV